MYCEALSVPSNSTEASTLFDVHIVPFSYGASEGSPTEKGLVMDAQVGLSFRVVHARCISSPLDPCPRNS
jgi:hypothetical protein